MFTKRERESSYFSIDTRQCSAIASLCTIKYPYVHIYISLISLHIIGKLPTYIPMYTYRSRINIYKCIKYDACGYCTERVFAIKYSISNNQRFLCPHTHTHTCTVYLYDCSQFLKCNLSPRLHSAKYVIMIKVTTPNFHHVFRLGCVVRK